MYNYMAQQRKELWRRFFPTTVANLTSIAQLFLTVAIVGCEVIAWFSLACASCCCRTRNCGIGTLVFQCLSLIMASCVVGFDIYFLVHPTQCFFSNRIFISDAFSRSDMSTLYDVKVRIIWGQLAAGVLMFISNIFYVIFFVETNRRVKRGESLPHSSSAPITLMPQIHQYPSPYANPVYGYTLNRKSVVQQYVPPPPQPPTNQLTCPRCATSFPITIERY
ncbi:hypothetical protein I4U23_019885 [Adineta vaga]|nr:hypothetical protein I4U23_019885 [Adineta vaga]